MGIEAGNVRESVRQNEEGRRSERDGEGGRSERAKEREGMRWREMAEVDVQASNVGRAIREGGRVQDDRE